MANLKATPNNFAVVVGDVLKEYSEDVSDVVYESADEVSDEAVRKLKGAGSPDWKKFPKAWTRKLKRKTLGAVEATVHLKSPMYRIGHLLEFDHASRGGGRTVDGFHFIEPVANDVAVDFEDKIVQKIGAN